MGSLGDVARGLALVPLLKGAAAELELHWLVEPKWREVVEAQPGIDKVVVFQRQRGVRGVASLFRALRAERYDAVLDLQRHAKSGLFSRMTGAPLRIGFARSDSKEGNWLFHNRHIPAAKAEVPKMTQYLEFPRALGIDVPAEVRTPYLSAPAIKAFRPPSAPFAVVVIGSSWESKDWPLTGYVKAIELLLQESSLSLVIVGDRSQIERAAKLKQIYPTGRVCNLVGNTTLGELMHVLKEARVCIGPDSGPGHLAAGFGTPTVTIFGPTSAVRTAPLGVASRALKSTMGCAPCYRRKCPGLDSMCMRSQDPRAVVDAAMELVRVHG